MFAKLLNAILTSIHLDWVTNFSMHKLGLNAPTRWFMHVHYSPSSLEGLTNKDSKSAYIANGTLSWYCPLEYLTYGFLIGISILTASSHHSMKVITKNKEDYISFLIKVKVGTRIDKNGIEVPIEVDLRFIDSFRFMSSSLDSLVNNLSRGGHKFRGFMGYT